MIAHLEVPDILPIMVKDHNKLENLLTKLEDASKKGYEDMIKVFHKFEWELEKHIFTEEKAIFTSYNPVDISEGYKMLPTLMKQHNIMLNNLNSWREDIKKKRMPSDIYGFREFLIKHRNFEEQEVYPRLDETLDESQKTFIIGRINEIVSK